MPRHASHKTPKPFFRIVQHFLQQVAVETIPWSAMSPDMNPIEHVWDFIGRKIIQRNPKCQNIQSKENQPQTVTPPPPKAVVPKMWLSWNEVFRWRQTLARPLPERWQAVGMHNSGFSHRRVADHFRVNHSIIVRLMQRFRQTGNITDCPHADRPRMCVQVTKQQTDLK
jgi:hypothetical protein